MMGRLEDGQERLFYNIRLEDQVPLNHLVRKLDAVLDFDGIRSQLKPFYSDIGRPSVDPELMVRMLLLGYCYSIRSERKLCEEVRFNLAYKWFCGLGFEDEVPDLCFSRGHGFLPFYGAARGSRSRWTARGRRVYVMGVDPIASPSAWTGTAPESHATSIRRPRSMMVSGSRTCVPSFVWT